MMCEHLIKLSKNERLSIALKNELFKFANEIIYCDGTFVQCPKKKQPCEINARCWRIGKMVLIQIKGIADTPEKLRLLEKNRGNRKFLGFVCIKKSPDTITGIAGEELEVGDGVELKGDGKLYKVKK